MIGVKIDDKNQGEMKLDQIKREICIESEKSFSQLKKNLQTEKFIEDSLVGYILKGEDFDEAVYKLSSKHLEDYMPKLCKIEESQRVVVECFYNGHWGYWKFSPILGKVANKSGFSSVERWLDSWAKKQENFEYNKKYFLWLLKIKYPIVEPQMNS